MKGKVLIVLFSLALVFGMLMASCDNGTAPADPYKTDSHKWAGEFNPEVNFVAFIEALVGGSFSDLDNLDDFELPGTPPTAWASPDLDKRKVYLDYYQNDELPTLKFPGDDKVDGGPISYADALKLVGEKVPFTDYKITAVVLTYGGDSVPALKIATP